MNPSPPTLSPRALAVAVLSSAAATLAFEVALTRVASALFFTHLTTLLLAACMAALGLGAAFLHRYAARRPVTADLLLWLTVLCALSGVAALLCAVYAPFLFLAGAFAWPFFLAGAFAAAAYRLSPTPTLIFALEALGGAAGAWLGPWLLASFGDLGAALLSLTLLLVTALALVGHARDRRSLALLLPLLVLVPVQLASRDALLRLDPFATPGFLPHLVEQTRALHGRVLQTRTDSYARTDLVQTDEPWLRYLYTDRMYPARAVRWDGQTALFPDPPANELSRLKRLAFTALQPKRVLVLGAGGGLDVALALQAGATDVDAVEVNAAMVGLVRELGAFCGHIYGRSDVHVHVAEARRFLRDVHAPWDVIQLSLIQTDSASLRTLAGVQNWVMTRESADQYLRSLTPGGTLVVVQNTLEIANHSLETLASALVARGVAPDAVAAHFVVVALTDGERNPFSQLLLVRPQPFATAERAQLLAQAALVGAQPRVLPAFNVAHAVPTDARPFFFALHPLLAGLYGALSAIALLLAWSLFARRRSHGRSLPRRTFWQAALLGAGLMLVQGALLADAQFLLGFPPLAVAWTVGGLLAASAVGALLAGRTRLTPQRQLLVSGALTIIALFLLAVLGPAAPFALDLPPAYAHVQVALLVLPMGLVLGPCFPALLQLAPATDRAGLYAVDGLGAVAGGGAAALFAAYLGAPAVVLAAGCCYLAVVILALARR